MLIERTFAIGGALVLLFGAALAALVVGSGAWQYGIGLVLAPALLVGFGVFFLYVGRQAREDRERLLAVGDPTRAAPGRPAAPRR